MDNDECRKKAMKRLHQQWKYAAKKYDEKNFLGIFLYGSQNYGLANEDSDVDSKIIYLPPFEDFCFGDNLVSETLIVGQDHIDIKDIRLMRKMFMKQSMNYLEILYTDYFILNERYRDLWERYFISHRDDISAYDRSLNVKAVAHQLENSCMKKIRQEFGAYDAKKIYNARRLYFFLQDYMTGVPYAQCLKCGNERKRTLLLGIKNNSEQRINKKDLDTNNLLKEIEEGVTDILLYAEGLESPRHEAAASALDEGTIEIIKRSFGFGDPEEFVEEEYDPVENFKSKLTLNEERAYLSIVQEIGAEGHISIKKLTDKANISRPVYTSLLNKMDRYGIAEIVNRGVKGTYIRIIHPELRQKALDFS